MAGETKRGRSGPGGAPPPRATRLVTARYRPWWVRDLPVVLASALVVVLLLGHRLVPDVASLSVVVESFLPWLGLLVLPVGFAALVNRSRAGGIALVAPVLVWVLMFGAAFLPGPSATGEFRAITQNLDAANPRPAATVAALVRTRADLVAVQELSAPAATRALNGAYPHHLTVGTVGLWSRFPLSGGGPVDLDLGWNRALRANVATTWGSVKVYVVHLASVRPGADRARDRTLERLTTQVRSDPAAHLLLLGDLNTASTDRQLGRLVPPLRDAQREAGVGFGFTWPAVFPITRPDQLLYRGLTATSATVSRTGESDHRAASAEFRVTR